MVVEAEVGEAPGVAVVEGERSKLLYNPVRNDRGMWAGMRLVLLPF